MGKVLIVYASRANETKGIAELIAEGIRLSGHEPVLKPASTIKTGEDLKGYDGYALGSPTYHGEMMTSMKQILFMAEQAELAGKPGGAFGAYGWTGEANLRIFDTMAHIHKMKMVSGPLMLKASWVEGGIESAQEYGKTIAGMI
ncbi:MAG: FprA family A-type flavoprotein [Desulfobacter sp.]|nr:FprA family A-type flavoprotein [Desulfobacter sp.]WDP83868.1 MAG: FprA family A-type flavoprotein [Desulfobacter sp.]